MVNVSHAETLYVTDLLRLNVHEEPQSKGPLITTINSGDPVTILERQPGYAKIQTSDGQTGWAKSAYLVADKPARLIVSDMEQQLIQMREQLSAAQKDTMTARKDAEKYHNLLKTTEKTFEEQNVQLRNIQQQNEKYEIFSTKYASSVPIKIFLIAGILLFLIGTLIGWYIMDYRIRKRHGGFRI
jgi:SH3 domain protein